MPLPRRSLGALLLALAVLLSIAPLAHTAPEAARRRAAPPVAFGAYVQGMQEDPGALDAFERRVRERTDIVSYYYGFGDVFPAATERRFADGGRRRVLLSWDMGTSPFRAWARGDHDAYLREIADAARAYPYAVYVRPWPEMNGDWQTFQPTPAGDRPAGGTYAEFVAAWRHVVSYTRAQGADNLRWVFNPAADTYPETTPVHKIWPGSRYVDVLGIDGFNWGADDGWGRWKSFRTIFQPMYDKLTALDARAPVWICEFGSKEPTVADGAPVDPAHSKASWIREAYAVGSMPRIRAMIYFHARKERDWRVDSSRASLLAFRRAVNDG